MNSQKKEIKLPTKEEIEKYYIEENHSNKDALEFFGLSCDVFQALLNKYGIHKRGKGAFEYLCSRISREAIIKYYIEEDHSYYDTISFFKIDESKFLNLCKHYNINKKSYKLNKLLASINEEEVAEYYKNHSYNNTLEHFGINTHILDKIISKFGINKLNRTKKNEPLNSYLSRVSKEEIYQYYIIENHSYNDTTNHFNIPAGMFEKICNFYNVVKIKHVNKFTYYKDAIKDVDKEEFKCYYIDQNHSLKETALHFNISEDVTQRLINDLDINKRKHYPELIKQKYEQTCLEKYGVEHTLLLDKCKENARPYRSGPNLHFQSLLEAKGLVEGKDFEIEFRIGRRPFDFKVGNYLIEIDPWATHNVTWNKYFHINYKPIGPEYHREKTLFALKNGYSCIHVFDWMDKKQIIEDVLNNRIKLKDRGEISKHLFNYKTNKEVYEYGPWVVEIYDDGFEFLIN